MHGRAITDLDIQALIDGEMSDHEALQLMDAITKNPVLHNRYLLYKKQKTLLKSWWKDN